jgi:hypothetical protein
MGVVVVEAKARCEAGGDIAGRGGLGHARSTRSEEALLGLCAVVVRVGKLCVRDDCVCIV